LARAIQEGGELHEAKISKLIKAQARDGHYITTIQATPPKHHVKSITRAEVPEIYRCISMSLRSPRAQS
jgi:hypothetical protein